MKLTFDIDRAVAVEHHLGRKLGEIVKEAESDTGLALGTLRALLAAGSAPLFMPQLLGYELTQYDLTRANGMLQASGAGACAEAVGKALGAFLRRIEREAP
ncbi:MAG: hypothetical protein K0Q69_1180 [Devosia sp.]|jgi:hypothetical protein|nr:hypothetical protein [Devosia sp.]